jgi:hypothetical protein
VTGAGPLDPAALTHRPVLRCVNDGPRDDRRIEGGRIEEGPGRP